MAIVILAITGVAKGSDVIAHLMGFICGVALGVGVYFGNCEKIKKNSLIQIICGTFAIILLALAWFMAIKSFTVDWLYVGSFLN